MNHSGHLYIKVQSMINKQTMTMCNVSLFIIRVRNKTLLLTAELICQTICPCRSNGVFVVFLQFRD